MMRSTGDGIGAALGCLSVSTARLDEGRFADTLAAMTVWYCSYSLRSITDPARSQKYYGLRRPCKLGHWSESEAYHLHTKSVPVLLDCAAISARDGKENSGSEG